MFVCLTFLFAFRIGEEFFCLSLIEHLQCQCCTMSYDVLFESANVFHSNELTVREVWVRVINYIMKVVVCVLWFYVQMSDGFMYKYVTSLPPCILIKVSTKWVSYS